MDTHEHTITIGVHELAGTDTVIYLAMEYLEGLKHLTLNTLDLSLSFDSVFETKMTPEYSCLDAAVQLLCQMSLKIAEGRDSIIAPDEYLQEISEFMNGIVNEWVEEYNGAQPRCTCGAAHGPDDDQISEDGSPAGHSLH
jgi:hypothetical protein